MIKMKKTNFTITYEVKQDNTNPYLEMLKNAVQTTQLKVEAEVERILVQYIEDYYNGNLVLAFEHIEKQVSGHYKHYTFVDKRTGTSIVSVDAPSIKSQNNDIGEICTVTIPYRDFYYG